jgi:ribosomal protein S12 methylthiotransferase
VVGFVALGCAKNLVDSEKMLAEIAESGAVLSDESAADTIVVNTCGFLESARQEALQVLRGLAVRKRRGEIRRIVVAGCLVQRDGERLRATVPEIDALVGVNNRADVARAVWHGPQTGVDLYLGDYHPQGWSDQGRLRLTPRHYGYVRISEGCNQKCTFCTIPSIRGPVHSKHPDALVAECRELIADGARELILIGQDTTSFGADLDFAPGLAGLLRRLDAECDGARWIRLMYVYPSVLTAAMLDAIAECRRIVKYIDIPLQHINDRMLRAMGRRVNRRQTEALLAEIRRRIPGVAIRTTFIVGFPGETEGEFEELVAFVRDFGFDAAGAFQYSLEPETPAGRMRDQHAAAVKRERYERLMRVQQEVALAAARRRIGRTLEVVVDHERAAAPLSGRAGVEAGAIRAGSRSRAADTIDALAVARHAGQAPEVDPVCLVTGGGKPGQRLVARCTNTRGYDLVVTRTA